MLTICPSSHDGMHRLEWASSPDDGAGWACQNEGCGAFEPDVTGHQGGHVAIDTLFAILIGLFFAGLMALAIYHDFYYEPTYEIWTTEGVKYTK